MCYFEHFFHFLNEKNRKFKKNAIFAPKNGINIARRHEIGVQNVQMGQNYVKRGQHRPKTGLKWTKKGKTRNIKGSKNC